MQIIAFLRNPTTLTVPSKNRYSSSYEASDEDEPSTGTESSIEEELDNDNRTALRKR